MRKKPLYFENCLMLMTISSPLRQLVLPCNREIIPVYMYIRSSSCKCAPNLAISTLSYACLGPLATDFLLTANCAYILIIHNYSSDNNEHIYRAEFSRSNIIFFIKQEKEYCLTLRYIGEISYQLIIETLLFGCH